MYHTWLPESWCEDDTEVVVDVWLVSQWVPDQQDACVLILTQQVEKLRLHGIKA